MPVDASLVGRPYPAAEPYEVSREKVREFALALGDDDLLSVDLAAARAAGYRDLVAPPTFLTVLAFRFAADGPLADPRLGLDYARVVHGEQRFTAHRPVVAGDVLHVTSSIERVRAAAGNDLVTVRTDVTDAGDGAPVATLVSTIVSRGTAAPDDGGAG